MMVWGSRTFISIPSVSNYSPSASTSYWKTKNKLTLGDQPEFCIVGSVIVIDYQSLKHFHSDLFSPSPFI